jgi:rhomboid family GlyGly-CTERM serine protease
MGDVFTAIGELLQYDRQAIAAGQLWRVVTGHAVHFGLEHFVWDAAVFVVLFVLCWRIEPRRCLVSLAVATLAIPGVLFVVQPGLATYRGLSGLDSALYVTGALALGGRLWSEGRRSVGIAAFASVAALAAKVAYELATGQTLFVDAASVGFEPVPLAHVTGALAGMVAFIAHEQAPGRKGDRPCAGTPIQAGCGLAG